MQAAEGSPTASSPDTRAERFLRRRSRAASGDSGGDGASQRKLCVCVGVVCMHLIVIVVYLSLYVCVHCESDAIMYVCSMVCTYYCSYVGVVCSCVCRTLSYMIAS